MYLGNPLGVGRVVGIKRERLVSAHTKTSWFNYTTGRESGQGGNNVALIYRRPIDTGHEDDQALEDKMDKLIDTLIDVKAPLSDIEAEEFIQDAQEVILEMVRDAADDLLNDIQRNPENFWENFACYRRLKKARVTSWKEAKEEEKHGGTTRRL